MIALQGLYLFW